MSLFLVRAYAKAHGVTARAILGYLLIWVGIAVTARYRLSSLGLNFAPAGSSPLDTVAILTTLLPAGVVARCVRSRVPHLEATRARHRQPAQARWLCTLCLVAAASPVLITPILQEQIDKPAFLATWSVVLGTYLLSAAAMPAGAALAATLLLMIVFSTPELIPWDHNILYNVNLSGVAAWTGGVLLLATIALASMTNRTDRATNQDLAY